MGSIVIGVLVLAAIAVAAYLQRDKLKAIFDKKTSGSPIPTVSVAPAAPVALAGIDYAKWGKYTPYELQMMVGRADGPFPRGIPPEWDWKEWARVNGKVDPTMTPDTGPAPDMSGPDLNDRSMHYKDFFAGTPEVWFFDHPGGPATLDVVGVSGAPLIAVTDSLSGVFDGRKSAYVFGNRHEAWRAFLPKGRYTYTVTVAVNGRFGVQYQAV